MTPEAQRIAIATALGWVSINTDGTFHSPYGVKHRAMTGWHPLHQGEIVPNYLNDLNAMHEAEKVLTNVQWNEYRVQLCGATREIHYIRALIHATAAQRAEAFLKALRLWKEAV